MLVKLWWNRVCAITIMGLSLVLLLTDIGIIPVAVENSQIKLYNNPQAEDPTMGELEAFLLSDKTDELYYINGSFMCLDFARQLHDNAEVLGIKSAVVIVTWENESFRHALNAFNTIDEGLVYIDDTGYVEGEVASYPADKIAGVAVGEEYFSFDGAEIFKLGTSPVTSIDIQW